MKSEQVAMLHVGSGRPQTVLHLGSNKAASILGKSRLGWVGTDVSMGCHFERILELLTRNGIEIGSTEGVVLVFLIDYT